MIDTWTEEREEMRAAVRKFTMKELEPWVGKIEETGEMPNEVVQLMADNGYLGVRIDPKFGGAGAPLSTHCLILEEFSRSHRGFSLIAGSASGISAAAIMREGTPEQQQKFLPGLVTGKMMTAFALTEPGAGSDSGAITTFAKKVDGGWVINGRKHFISGGHRADFLILIAVTDKEKKSKGGVTAFIIEKDFPGFSVSRVEQTMATNFIKLAELTFEDCFVPDSALLGKVGGGFGIAMHSLAEGRLGVSSSCIGAADRLIEMGIEQAHNRSTFGKPLASRQAIQWMLADSKVELEAGRALTYQTIRDIDNGKPHGALPSMCKLYCSEMVNRVADRIVQMHGGMGLMRSFPVERFYRDVRYFRIGEGASEIHRMIIARDLLGRSDS